MPTQAAPRRGRRRAVLLLLGGAVWLPPARGWAQSGWTSLGGEVSTMQGAMQALGARTEGEDIVVDLPADVLFDFDKSNIRRDADEALTHLLTIVEAQAARGPIRVEGHTVSKGGEAYNQALSQRRAASVKAWLVAHGVEAGRIATAGYGKTRPRVSNTRPDGSDDPQGRQKNRRVTVFIRQG